MIWATVAEVREWWADQQTAYAVTWSPLPVEDTGVQTLIDSATRTLDRKAIRYPLLDEATDRAVDEKVRANVMAAVAETIAAGRKTKAEAAALDASLPGMADIVRAGGSVTAGSLSVTGARTASGNATASTAGRVPIEAYEALAAAGMIGGSVPAW